MENKEFKNQVVNIFEQGILANQTFKKVEFNWEQDDLLEIKVEAEKFGENEYGLRNDASSVINYITGACFTAGYIFNEKGEFVDFIPDFSWIETNETEDSISVRMAIEVRVKNRAK